MGFLFSKKCNLSVSDRYRISIGLVSDRYRIGIGSVLAYMKKSISVFYRIGHFEKWNLSVYIGIGQYEKKIIGRALH